MEFAQLVETQHGVFTRAQARTAGFSTYRINRRVAAGEWQVATPKVLLLRTAADDRAQADWVALLAAGQGAAMASFSAARLHHMEPRSQQVCIAVPTSRHICIPGARILREKLFDEDVMLIEGALATSRARTVIDCLVALPEREGLDYLDRALQQRWISYDELLLRVQLRAGHRGTRKLVELVALVSGGAQFEAERRLVALLRRHHVAGWRCNLALPGIGVIDLAFPHLRLAIEVDGVAWHSDVRRFQADRTKQNKLAAGGWTVLRFTWRDLVERPERVMSTIGMTMQRLLARQDRQFR